MQAQSRVGRPATPALRIALLPVHQFYWTHDYYSSVNTATDLLGDDAGNRERFPRLRSNRRS
jgi:hypothetical protein